MEHEKIKLDPTDWSKAHDLAEYSLNRCAANIHELRSDVAANMLESYEKYVLQREADLEKINTRLNAHGDRITTMEARAFAYGAAAGFIVSAISAIIAIVSIVKMAK